MAATWIFQQVGDPSLGLKRLVLDGPHAPHGRPRQKALAHDKIAVREYTVRYSGNNEPTRHLFGLQFDDWELTGRFRDAYGGASAEDRVAFIRDFVADQRQLVISWGDLLSVRGFIRSFESGWESQHEVTWTMVVAIDRDNYLNFNRAVNPITVPASPGQHSGAIDAAISKALAPAITPPTTLKGNVLDMLGSAVDSVVSATSLFTQAADQMQGFEKALIGDIRRFRAGLGQVKTALIQFRDVFQGFRSDLVIESSRAIDQLTFTSSQASSGAASLEALLAIVAADQAAEAAERGKIKGLYEAKRGDTWESMSTQIFGSPDRADDIRAANGIPPGSAPVEGTIYQVPT